MSKATYVEDFMHQVAGEVLLLDSISQHLGQEQEKQLVRSEPVGTCVSSKREFFFFVGMVLVLVLARRGGDGRIDHVNKRLRAGVRARTD